MVWDGAEDGGRVSHGLLRMIVPARQRGGLSRLVSSLYLNVFGVLDMGASTGAGGVCHGDGSQNWGGDGTGRSAKLR